MNQNTNSVQSFIRFLTWILTFLILSLFTLLPTLSSLESGTGSGFIAFWVFLVLNVFVASTVSRMFFVLPEWQKLVLLRLGKYAGTKGAGFFIIPPFIYSIADIVDTRITTHRVEATATLTKDNVPTKVTAAIEYEIEDPKKAVINVRDYLSSVVWLSTEGLKNTIGSLDLKELLSNRDQIAAELKNQIDQAAVNYGVNIRAVRITDIDTPPSLVEELAVIARARRAAEAKTVQAQAEVKVAAQIAKAAQILTKNKQAMRLREIQALAEISKEESSMVIVYPSGDREGKAIAQATSGSMSQRKK